MYKGITERLGVMVRVCSIGCEGVRVKGKGVRLGVRVRGTISQIISI